MSSSYTKTRIMVECALMIALGTILANIKIYELPNGGSITLFSMVPFILVSFRHGVKWGLFTGFVNGCLQMLLGFWAPPTPTTPLPPPGRLLLRLVIPAPLSTRTLMRLVLLVSTTPTTRTAALLAMSSPTP